MGTGNPRACGHDRHVLDLMDVVAAAGPPGEADQDVLRQCRGVAEHLGAVHGHGDASRGGGHYYVVDRVAQRRDSRVGGDVVEFVGRPGDRSVGDAHEVVRGVDRVLVSVKGHRIAGNARETFTATIYTEGRGLGDAGIGKSEGEPVGSAGPPPMYVSKVAVMPTPGTVMG